jgi:NADH-quinone oxidoreductase subunit I
VNVPNAKKHTTLPNPIEVGPTIKDPYKRQRLPLAALATGMKSTLKVFFRKPVTFEYPEVRRPIAERYRGRIGLELDLCIGCTLCAQACPNGTCFMVDFKFEKAADMNAKFPNKKDKFPAVDTARCIYCSLCEEVCPTGAIHMTPEYELSRTRKDQVYMPDILQKTEAEIDAMDQEIVRQRLAEGQRLITINDKTRL